MAETPLTFARPTGTPRGGVIVIQEAFGVNDHIVDLCDRLAAAGWTAVAPHLFHRTGDPVIGYDDIPSIMPHMGALTLEGVIEDVDAASAALVAEGIEPARQAVVGFCLGGGVTFHAAVRRPLGAAVTFYGGGIRGRFAFPSQLDEAADLQTPWLGLYGDLDQGIPIDDVEALRAAAATASVETDVVRYPDAEHGFNCDRRPSFDETSATDAWARMLAWFERYVPTA